MNPKKHLHKDGTVHFSVDGWRYNERNNDYTELSQYEKSNHSVLEKLSAKFNGNILNTVPEGC